MSRAIDCTALATELNCQTRDLSVQVAHGWRQPRLAILYAGNNPASDVYVRNKERACRLAGVNTRLFRFGANADTETVCHVIERLNADPEFDGIMLQLPVPPGVNARQCIDLISPGKDVDGLTAYSQGGVWTDGSGYTACTAQAVMWILDRAVSEVAGRDVVIVGRSNIVGKPLAGMLTAASATVTICHSQTKDLAGKLRNADIIVSATGEPWLIKPDMVKEGAVLIDVGIYRSADGLKGDIDPACHAKAAAYTTVPGGVGPVTVSCLVRNVVEAAADHRSQGVRAKREGRTE